MRLLLQNSRLTKPAADLHRRLQAGMLLAQAERYKDENGTSENAIVPQDFWQVNHEFPHQSWASGDFELRERTAYGVQLDRQGVFSLSESQAEHGPSQLTWGTRRKEWWDDLLIEVARALFAGHLIPKRQSDIEKFMLDWAASHDHDVGPTAVRERARKLWHAISNVE